MSTNYIGKLLIEKGEKFYSIGKGGIGSLIAGLSLAAFICIVSLITEGRIYFLDGYTITVVGSVLSILLVTVGLFLLPFFFFGLHYMGLGRICENTEK